VVVPTNSASMMNKAVKLVAPTPPTSSSPERVSGKHRFDNREAEADVRMRGLPHNLISCCCAVALLWFQKLVKPREDLIPHISNVSRSLNYMPLTEIADKTRAFVLPV